MNVHETRRYLMFGRVEAFGKANTVDFEPDSEAASRFAALAQIIHGLDAAKPTGGRFFAPEVVMLRMTTEGSGISRASAPQILQG